MIAPLKAEDKKLAYHMAKTCLRYKGAFDRLLASLLREALAKSRLDIQCSLYLACTQILVLRTPDHAAVHTSVEIAKSCFPKMAGLVNAVAKKIIKQRDSAILKAEYAVPLFLWDNWVNAYGEETAGAIAQAHWQEPPLDITSPLAIEAGQLMPGGTIRLPKGIDFSELPAQSWAQDLAASLPVKLLGDIKNKTVLDACAAPGGKTMQLAQAGAKVTALDISAKRLERLQENLERTSLSAEIVCADLRKWKPATLYDIIVLDAPCTATGTIRRHPEIMHQRSPEDITKLSHIQQELIAQCLDWLKPEGILLYITCSLQPEEGEQQMHPYANAILPFAATTAGIPDAWITPQGYLRSLPCYLAEQGGMDGFFAAMLKKSCLS